MKYALMRLAIIPPALAASFYGLTGSNVARSETSGSGTRYYNKSGSYRGSKH